MRLGTGCSGEAPVCRSQGMASPNPDIERGFQSRKHFVVVDHNDGQFFRAMEWLMLFFKSTIAVNGFSMVLTKMDHHH